MTEAADTTVVWRVDADRANLRKVNPVSSGHTAFVYLTKRGTYVLGEGRLTMGELWLNTPKEAYAVDVSPHQASFALHLPSQEEAFSFAASVRATWQVVDPVAAVRGRLQAPDRAVRQCLEEYLRELTRGFDVESSAAAERKINLELSNRIMPISDAVSVSRCTVVLTLDDATREHIAGRTLAERERETLSQSKRTEAQQHELALQRTAHQQELERLTAQHQLALKDQRMKFYADALRTDSHNLLALRLLDEHGEHVNDVIELIMRQRNMEFEGAKAVLNELLEANLLNRKDVSAIIARASEQMVRHLRGENPLGLGPADGDAAATPPLRVGSGRRPDDDPGDEDDDDDLPGG